MKSISILPLFLIVSLSLVTAQVQKPVTNTATNIIKKACASSTKKPLCLSVLNSLDLQGVALIALKNALDSADHTFTSIRSLISKGDIDDSKLKDGLSDCSNCYRVALDQMDKSMEALVSKNFEDVNNLMKNVNQEFESCNDNMKGLSAPEAKDLVKKNRNVRDLCTNALELIDVSSRDTN